MDRNPSSPLAKATNLEVAVTFLRETGVRLPDTALTGGRGSASRKHCVEAPQYDAPTTAGHPYTWACHMSTPSVCPSSL